MSNRKPAPCGADQARDAAHEIDASAAAPKGSQIESVTTHTDFNTDASGPSNRRQSGDVLWETEETIGGFHVTNRVKAASPAQDDLRRRWLMEMLFGRYRIAAGRD